MCVCKSLIHFAVLDEDALGELLSFLEDFLVVDVGHGGDEALEEEEDMADAQRLQPDHQVVPPGLYCWRGRPPLAGTGTPQSKTRCGCHRVQSSNLDEETPCVGKTDFSHHQLRNRVCGRECVGQNM